MGCVISDSSRVKANSPNRTKDSPKSYTIQALRLSSFVRSSSSRFSDKLSTFHSLLDVIHESESNLEISYQHD